MPSPASPPPTANNPVQIAQTSSTSQPFERTRVARRPSRKTIANPEDRLSRVSYYTSNTDRTSVYTIASEYESAIDHAVVDATTYAQSVDGDDGYATASSSVMDHEDANTGADVHHDDRNRNVEEDSNEVGLDIGRNVMSVTANGSPVDYERCTDTSSPWFPAEHQSEGSDQEIGEPHLSYDAYPMDSGRRSRRNDSLSSQATVQPFQSDIRYSRTGLGNTPKPIHEGVLHAYPSVIPSSEPKEKYDIPNANTELEPQVNAALTSPASVQDRRNLTCIAPSADGLNECPVQTAMLPSPDPFVTPPSSIKSGYRETPPEYKFMTSLKTREQTQPSPLSSLPSNGATSGHHVFPSTTFHSRNRSMSYTRGLNPPMTTATRNRRKSGGIGSVSGGTAVHTLGKPSGSSTSSSMSGTTLGGTGDVHLEGRKHAGDDDITNLAVVAPALRDYPSPLYGNVKDSAGNIVHPQASAIHNGSPLANQSRQHEREFSSSSSSMNAQPAHNAWGTGGFTITAHSPRSGSHTPSSRPGTGTSSERETFSSPPIYVPPFPARGPFLPFASSGGGDGGGDSGTSTPRDTSFERSRSTSALNQNMAALTQHVPGLGGPETFKGSMDHSTPYDGTASSGPFTPVTGTQIFSEDPFNEDSQIGIGLRTKSALLKGEVEKPWLKQKDWKTGASWWITFGVIMAGVAASAYTCFRAWDSVMLIEQPLCLVMQDDFDTFDVDHDGAKWMHEVDMSGFGNGEFEMTTNSLNNSFVEDGKLYIVPTLTELSIGHDNVFNGYTYNITGCTNTDNDLACGAVSNQTTHTVINPVMSARITTQKSHSIRYGRVEIRAKLPKGDWLWPALWMLPVNNTYGPWPLSGEIDIMESRGNPPKYPYDGDNVVRGSLNWGPLASLNAAYRTFGTFATRHHAFSDGFHVYAVEWTPQFIRTYVDSRLHRTLELKFDKPFFARGEFPPVIQNDSQTVAVQNPWFGRPNSAPFDQPFFLIMNVAVGGTNGWFPDGLGNKPWVDASESAMYDFAKAKDTWYATWSKDPRQRAMVVDYVKMWELC